ncbi:MAG: cell division protein FtsA [Myxococcales bacterium]|nr:cell division protein FtsA [Myxococcales bacterium]
MTGEQIVASIDIGTVSVKCVVAVCAKQEEVTVIGTGTAAMKGMRGGVVHNRAEVVSAIRRAKEEAALMAGCDLEEVVVTVSGQLSEGMNSAGSWRVKTGEVSRDDIVQVLDIACARRLPDHREVAFCIPGQFLADEQISVGRPLGVRAVRLEVLTHLIVTQRGTQAELEACCREAGVQVKTFIHSGVATAEVYLRESDRESGAIIIDIGGNTTEVAVYCGGALVYTSVIPFGGEHVTADLQECLSLPMVEAERLKQVAGCALAWTVGEHERVEVPGGMGGKTRTLKRDHVAGIIEARYEELLHIVRASLERAGITPSDCAGVVLTGGGSNVACLTDLADRVLGVSSARGEPRGLSGLADAVRHPKYATATGAVLCAFRGRADHFVRPRTTAQSRSTWSRFVEWIR